MGRACEQGLEGPSDRVVRGANGLAEAGGDEIAFLANVRYERFMADTSAAAVIVAEDYRGAGECLIRCKDPYFAFREAMVLLYGFREHPFRGIDKGSRIDPSAELGRTYRFLGVDDAFRPKDLTRPVHRVDYVVSSFDEAQRRRLADYFRDDVEATVSLFPEIDLSLWAEFAD